jgi:tetratricopeptide (TPR) repeat protein
MKRNFSLYLLVLLIAACASTGGKSALTLYDAIEQSAEQIAGNLPAGSRVAIVAFESEDDSFSDYIMEELTGALFDRNIEVADRQNLEYVYKELDFQMSGEVSEETAKSIGKFLAADMVITGQMLNLDNVYRYRTSAINVETAVRASVTRLDIRRDSETRRMVAAITNQQAAGKTEKYGVSADVTPRTAGTFLDRGIMFASRGEFGKAVADFDEAIRLNPDMDAAYALRARALFASVSHVTGIGDNFSGVSTINTRGRITAEQRQQYERAVVDLT